MKELKMKKRKIVFITGAGISKESGISTFRDLDDGMWNSYPVEKVATKSGVFNNIHMAIIFFDKLKDEISKASTNAAHDAIAELENHADIEVVVITQNIDDLHRKAQSSTVLELHGNIFEYMCKSRPAIPELGLTEAKGCHTVFKGVDFNMPADCPSCGAKATVIANMVLFEEALDMNTLSTALYHAETADLVVQVGTSAMVYPAASLIEVASIPKRIYCDIANPQAAFQYQHEFIGPATVTVPQICRKIISGEI